MINFEEEKIISIDRARELIVGTGLENANDEELAKVLESIKQFCEINFELYLYLSKKQDTISDENECFKEAA
ncbi:MAG: hypothetical protein U0W65_11835 [Bacteroidia bacterium]